MSGLICELVFRSKQLAMLADTACTLGTAYYDGKEIMTDEDVASVVGFETEAAHKIGGVLAKYTKAQTP